MDCNNITRKNSLLYKIYNFVKFRKSQKIILNKVENNKVSSINILIKNIEDCNNLKINDLFRCLIPYEKYIDIYLHGSWADNTNNSFSDIDDFIILKSSIYENSNDFTKVMSFLNKIDMSFCRIDPLQHHGHWIVCENELINYDNSFMPLFIMKEAKRIIGSNLINGYINETVSKKGLELNLLNTCKSINILSEKYFSNVINAYDLKCLVGSFALVPALVYQLRGDELNKPDSLWESKNLYTLNSYKCVQWATEIRNNWEIIVFNKKFKFFAIFSYFFSNPHLWRRFSSKFSPSVKKNKLIELSSLKLNKNDINSFISESLKLAYVR